MKQSGSGAVQGTMMQRLAGLDHTVKLRLILAVAVILRVIVAVMLGNEVTELPGTADQISYHTLAGRVLDGHGFSFGEAWWPVTGANEPTAHWSYLYTLFLTTVYGFTGSQPLVARLLQAVLSGILHPLLAYGLAREVRWRIDLDREQADRIALVAASITAVYLYFVYYAATLMTEALYIVAVLATLYFALRLARSTTEGGGLRTTLFFALAISAAVLLRQLYLLFLPFLFLWLLGSGYRNRTLRRTVLQLAVAGFLLVASILPATLYNQKRFDRFVLLNTNAGYALFWANHPIHGTSFIPAMEMGETYQRLIPDELRVLDEAALDQELLGQAIQFVVDEPGRYIRLSLNRIPAYFRFWPEASSGLLSNLSRVGSFALFLPFMLVGLIMPIRDALASQTRRRPEAPILLLYLFVLLYTGIHVLSWALVRYRLPVDAVLVLFAAVPLESLGTRIWRRFGFIGAASASYARE